MPNPRVPSPSTPSACADAPSSTLESVLDLHPRHVDHCAWQTLEGEVLVIHLLNRRVLGLNASGSLLWTHVDGKRTVSDLAQLLVEKYALTLDAAQRDCVAFIELMARRGLVDLESRPGAHGLMEQNGV